MSLHGARRNNRPLRELRSFDLFRFLAELVDEVARSTQLTKKHAEIIVNTVFDSIVLSLKAGEKIELTPAVIMRRMTKVSPYPYWHFFDAYPPGYLRARDLAYRLAKQAYRL